MRGSEGGGGGTGDEGAMKGSGGAQEVRGP